MSNKVSEVAQGYMNKMSKKMGAAGVFLGWLFFVCTAPDLQRVILGAIVAGLFIVFTLWKQINEFKYRGRIVDAGKTIMGRMSSAMTMAGGFLGGLFASTISMELKMWGGFAVVIIFIIMQGILDTRKAKMYYGPSANAKPFPGTPPARPPL